MSSLIFAPPHNSPLFASANRAYATSVTICAPGSRNVQSACVSYVRQAAPLKPPSLLTCIWAALGTLIQRCTWRYRVYSAPLLMLILHAAGGSGVGAGGVGDGVEVGGGPSAPATKLCSSAKAEPAAA